MENLKVNKNYFAYAAWGAALAAMAGSLYFSEVLNLTPCVLCWYQRILMYPLVIIIPVGILGTEKKFYRYVLPFSILGMTVALYHYLLYIGVIAENFSPCSNGVSCTARLIEWFGFINIPLLSLASFAIITLSMLFYRNRELRTAPRIKF